MPSILDEHKADPLFRKLRHSVGKAIADFKLIEEGDRIAVAVSGGKDSYTLMPEQSKLLTKRSSHWC